MGLNIHCPMTFWCLILLVVIDYEVGYFLSHFEGVIGLAIPRIDLLHVGDI